MARTVPGSGAVVSANFDTNFGVSSFTISNGGTGYASTDPPRIDITGTTAPTVSGSFYPIIINGAIQSITILSAGSGYFPLVSTASTAVGIASIGYDGNSRVLKSILLRDAGKGYSQAPTVTISDPESLSGIGTYQFNEIVVGSRSFLRARVKEWDADTLVLKVANVGTSKTAPDGKFFNGESIVGETSGASYATKNYVQDDTYDKYTENDEFETLGDSLLDFTESNPFGTF